jgi:hypothetical protein
MTRTVIQFLPRCTLFHSLCLVFAVLAIVNPPAAQATEYELYTEVLAGLTLDMAGGPYVLNAIVGSTVLSPSGEGDSLNLNGGFWVPVVDVMTGGPVEGEPVVYVNSLSPGFPNPFQTQITLRFSVAEQSPVKLIVYDVTGRRVTTLLDDRREPGRYHVVWHGRSQGGRSVASGVYFYRLQIGSWSKTGKMLRIR